MPPFLISLLLLGAAVTDEQPKREFLFEYETLLLPTPAAHMRVWLPLPQSDEVQQIADMQIQSDLPYSLHRDPEFGNLYLRAEKAGGVDDTIRIIVRFQVTRSVRKPDSVQDTTGMAAALKPDRLVPMAGIFKDIIRREKLRADSMRAVYDFILQEMVYGKPRAKDSTDAYFNRLPEKIKDSITREMVVDLYLKARETRSEFIFGNGNAEYACKIGVGNCTDFHSYFLSLSRTLGVPGRFHIGFLLPETEPASGSLDGYHCWADFYQPGVGWVPVDISEADKFPHKADYYFGTLDNDRVRFTSGRDILLDGYSGGPVNFFIYPVMEHEGRPVQAFMTRFRFMSVEPPVVEK